MAELAACGFTVEAPVDPGAGGIHFAIPGADNQTQAYLVKDSSGADTLPRENDDFNFSPSEPAAKTRRLMDGKPAPDLVLKFLGVKVCQ